MLLMRMLAKAVPSLIVVIVWTVGAAGTVGMIMDGSSVTHRAIWAGFATAWACSAIVFIMAIWMVMRPRKPKSPFPTPTFVEMPATIVTAKAGERIVCPNGHEIATFTRDCEALGDFGYIDATKFAEGQERKIGADMLCHECRSSFYRIVPSGAGRLRGQFLIEGEWR